MASGLIAFCLFAGGWILFPGLFLLQLHFWTRTVLGRRLQKKHDLSEKDCADIANKLVSTFQAILATITGTIVCSHCYDDVLGRSHPLTLLYAWFGLPYFYYDTISMFYVSTLSDNNTKCKKESYWSKFLSFVLKSQLLLVIHHIILVPAGFTILLFFRDDMKKGDFFMGTVYLMEASTPFVCFRFILSKFRMKSTIWYAVNGLIMLVLFPIFRILSFFYGAHLYGQQMHMSTYQALYEMPFGWKFAFFLAVAPQVYWYFLMWRGLIRMLFNTSSSTSKGQGFNLRKSSLNELNGAKDLAH